MENEHTAIATLGGGCFWCTEAVFELLRGVEKVRPGYSGGRAETADYRSVCSGTTRHAEVIQIEYDPAVVTFAEILEVFWATHDPTTPNQQGNDRGPQYRSVIFYHNAEQEAEARRSKAEVAPEVWDDPIVTEISPFEAFYPAEAYHHSYYQKTGARNPYCSFIISPKVAKFRKRFADKLKPAASS